MRQAIQREDLLPVGPGSRLATGLLLLAVLLGAGSRRVNKTAGDALKASCTITLIAA